MSLSSGRPCLPTGHPAGRAQALGQDPFDVRYPHDASRPNENTQAARAVPLRGPDQDGILPVVISGRGED